MLGKVVARANALVRQTRRTTQSHVKAPVSNKQSSNTAMTL
jgi:hypothetical protein